MAEHTQADESNVLKEVQKVVDGLIKFDADSRIRIYRTVGAFFGFDDAGPKAKDGAGHEGSLEKDSREPHFSTHEAPSPKDFVFRKQPSTGTERVACLGYYLAHYRDTPHFKTIDISKLNTEAAQAKLANASYTIRDATRSGLLAAAPKGTKQLSALGEKYVEALPDRAAARALASTMRGRRPPKKAGRNGSDEAGS